ncbi:hypothetical protein niasHT_013613 [Heterodera trifolii]|uniref:Uncharacterized protein n=1 Tax=Heterodera trifolii TaxID=157864 RepID=A0ABD2LED1_9BILA
MGDGQGWEKNRKECPRGGNSALRQFRPRGSAVPASSKSHFGLNSNKVEFHNECMKGKAINRPPASPRFVSSLRLNCPNRRKKSVRRGTVPADWPTEEK